jgi:hypothetical protein
VGSRLYATIKALAHHGTVSPKVLTCEMQRQQSRKMTVVTWFCEASPFFQCAGISHPTRPWGGGSRGDTRGGPYPGEETHAPARSFRFSPYTGPSTGRGLFAPSPVTLGFTMPVSPARGRVERDYKGREKGQTHPPKDLSNVRLTTSMSQVLIQQTTHDRGCMQKKEGARGAFAAPDQASFRYRAMSSGPASSGSAFSTKCKK